LNTKRGESKQFYRHCQNILYERKIVLLLGFCWEEEEGRFIEPYERERKINSV
jgi:hypothetical protein